MKNIIIIEDENLNISFLTPELINEGFTVEQTTDIKTGLKMLEDNNYDLILLDVSDYSNICNQIKEKHSIPVIVFIKQDIIDENCNADEFITKPFENSKFFAIIEKIFAEDGNSSELTFKELTINAETFEVKLNEKSINLSKKEFDLIHYLVKNKNKVLSRDQLLNHVWGVDYLGETNVVDVNIKHLRDKFGKLSKLEYIKTIRGIGYCCKE